MHKYVCGKFFRIIRDGWTTLVKEVDSVLSSWFQWIQQSSTMQHTAEWAKWWKQQQNKE